MAKYAGLSTSGQSMNEIWTAMPKSLQAIMGTGALDISKVSGYFGVLYIYLLLMATMLGATIIAKEERDKTAEFLFVKPVSRTRIICAKLSVAVVNIVMLNIVAGISSLYLVRNIQRRRISKDRYHHSDVSNADFTITIFDHWFCNRSD
ncbi:ABC transporter permease subunit [Lysinibacillus parviboronicapiens]|nr:ABC transporter permease subunit [Lysinibacillus parviboronicapiens]